MNSLFLFIKFANRKLSFTFVSIEQQRGADIFLPYEFANRKLTLT